MKNLIIAFAILLFSSCAAHHGLISSSVPSGDVIYEDIAYGVAQTNTFFGIGGLSQDALVLEAKRELIKNRPLKAHEAYQNFTVDFKSSFWPFFNKNKVTVSADVIKPTTETSYEPYSDTYKKRLSGRYLSNELFLVGDSVWHKKRRTAVINSIINDGTVRIEYLTKKDKIKTKRVSIKNIYTTQRNYKNLEIGGMFIFSEKKIHAEENATNGTIIAIGLNSLIVKDRSNDTLIVNHKK